MKPIYEPKGKAKEYGDLAMNIYTGCTHGCTYCYAPSVLRKSREDFHTNVKPRDGIVDAVRAQIKREGITGKLIHICFTCDPYPTGVDTTATRDIIKIIKESGNHVQILTKSDETRDLDLFDKNDWFGVTLTGASAKDEPNAARPLFRYMALEKAIRHTNTWVSCEPVLNAGEIYNLLETSRFINLFKIGKLNYAPSDINWGEFGRECERLCKEFGRAYYIKESLRAEMERIL